MTTRWRKFVLLAAPAILAGCVPMKFSGYQAIGDGSAEAGYCVGWIKDRLRIHAPSGVEFLVYTTEHGYRDAVLLGVDFSVPGNVSVQWESPKLVLRSPEWTRPRTWMIDRITSGPRTYDATAVLAGSSKPRVRNYSLTYYSTEMGTLAEPAIPRAGVFTLDLPALKINGEPFQPGPVRFEAYLKWGMYTCVQ